MPYVGITGIVALKHHIIWIDWTLETECGRDLPVTPVPDLQQQSGRLFQTLSIYVSSRDLNAKVVVISGFQSGFTASIALNHLHHGGTFRWREETAFQV